MTKARMYLAIAGATLLTAAVGLSAAGKGGTAPDPDRIEVIAHVPLSDGVVTQLMIGTYWRKDYLYLNRGAEGRVTILDVTNPAVPFGTGELDVPRQEADGRLNTVIGTAALIASPSATTPAARQTVTILSFADSEHPTVIRQFAGVTSMLKDTPRGLIYLVNSDGLWVLRMKPATDIQLQKEYEHYVLYNR